MLPLKNLESLFLPWVVIAIISASISLEKFEMPFSIKNIEEDILYYWFKLLYIDNTWEIYKINTEYDGNITECLWKIYQ